MKQIFLNLPVKNLQRSVTFFSKLGFAFDPRFSDEKATCMIIGENIYAMLLTEPFFQTFTSKQICDATKSTETLICLPCESRAQVDDLISKAAAAGAKIPRELQEMDMMYGHAFEDLDGHTWELIYMDPSKIPEK